jgi:galactokinase
VSAPGRVNLIGEHTDYSLLPVLPVAVQRRIRVEAEATGDRVVEAVSTAYDGVFRSDAVDNPPWSAYLGAAVALVDPVGARLRINGDLPSSGGLSSSSALTVAVLLALLRSAGADPEPGRLVDLAVQAERATGVEGGTMDQTIIVYAEPGTAMRIGFDPPERRPVAIPEHIAFVAGYSGTPAPKGGRARDAYNARVVGARTAAILLGADPPHLSRVVGTARDVDAALPALAVPPPEAAELSSGTYTDRSPLPVRAWARHVLSEAVRVDAAVEALDAGDVADLGRLFDASHASLADDFGSSTPELDGLVVAAKDAGASGARLTGAGFGGWAVAVCDRSKAAVVTEAMAAFAGDAFLIEPAAGVS